MDKLIIYGSPASPPSRAVYWACLAKELSFEYIDCWGYRVGSTLFLRNGDLRSVERLHVNDLAPAW